MDYLIHKWLVSSMEKRKLGRPRGPEHIKYQVLLDRESGEWGKSQPGGLSALVRRLLLEERARLDYALCRDLPNAKEWQPR